MGEKAFVSSAKVIQAILAVGRFNEPVFGAAAIASEKNRTFTAVSWQFVPFVAPEFPLKRRCHKLRYRRLHDVAKVIIGVNEVIAGEQVSVVFHRQAVAASSRMNAQTRLKTQPCLQCHLKLLDENPSDIVANPLVKDGAKEVAPLFRADRPIRNAIIWSSLNGWNELDELNPFVSEKPVNLQWMIGVNPIDDAKDVEINAVLLKQLEGSINFLKGRPPALVNPIGIVQLPGAVHAQADQKTMLLEEATPIAIEKDAIGLEGVFDAHVRLAILLLQGNGFAEKLQTHQGRFAALPTEGHFGNFLRLDVLAGEFLKHIIGHVETCALFVNLLLAQVEAVGAVQVADRTSGFKHDVKCRR